MLRTICYVILIFLCFGAAQSTHAQVAQARVFNEITVDGNKRFSDQDILATSGLRPGEIYGEDDLLAAIEELEFTGEFNAVRIQSQGDRLIITVDETPAFQGRLLFGGGFDSDDGLFAGAALSIDDALGIGARIDGELIVSEEVQSARFAVFDPDALTETIGLGFRLSYDNVDYDNVLFSYEEISAAPFVTFDFGQNRELETRLVFSSTDLTDVDPAASSILQAEVGREDRVSLGVSYRFGAIDPTAGRFTWAFLLDAEYGFAGDTNFVRTQARGDFYLPLARGFAVRSTVEVGHISGLGDDNVRAPDRFVLGGANLRGFERGTVTVRDINGATDTNLGGNLFAVARTDLLIPVFPDNTALGTFVFADLGSVWELETDIAPDGDLFDDFELRSSIGIGASYDFDFGRLEAYLAAPIEEGVGDEEQIFGVTFRANF